MNMSCAGSCCQTTVDGYLLTTEICTHNCLSGSSVQQHKGYGFPDYITASYLCFLFSKKSVQSYTVSNHVTVTLYWFSFPDFFSHLRNSASLQSFLEVNPLPFNPFLHSIYSAEHFRPHPNIFFSFVIC